MAQFRLGILTVIGLALVPGNIRAQQLVYGDTIVEIIGLTTWTAPEVEAAVKRFAPDISLASAACAIILRDSIGFGDASVMMAMDQERGEIRVVLTLVEPGQRHLVQFDSSAREPIAHPEGWSELATLLRANPSALHYFQHPDFLLDDAPVAFGRPVPEAAVVIRDRLRELRSEQDWAAAAELIRRSSNISARQMAALVLSNFPERSETWHLLAEGIRAAPDHAANGAAMILQALGGSGRYTTDWEPAEETLTALVGGTNLFAYNVVLASLLGSRISPDLARRLSRTNPELLAAHAASGTRLTNATAREFLDFLDAPNFGTEKDRWLAWIES